MVCLMLAMVCQAQKQLFNEGWLFHYGDGDISRMGALQGWEQVSLPHDWSMHMPFIEKNASGNDGGYLPTGTGWYKKTFSINDPHLPGPDSDEHQMGLSSRYELYFERVYMNSTVYVNGDSVGGRLETAVYGFPAGVGEPWFDTLESVLSHMLFSIPAVKGVEFGDGFGITEMMGSEANDPYRSEGGKVIALSNHNGGIIGGISNGMPIIFRTAVKPTPSIYKEQETIDLNTLENTTLQIKGRHDPAIIHRARVVVDSAAALVLCDQLALRYGTDWLAG